MRARSRSSNDTPAAAVMRMVDAALRDLPDRYRQNLANVTFAVSRVPGRRDRKRLGLRGGLLYGAYEGIPLTQRDSSYDRTLPDRITIFWGPLLRDFGEGKALADQVRKTVYHEIAHYFGLDEDSLRRTSVE